MDHNARMFEAGDRVRIKRPGNALDGATASVLHVREIAPRPGVMGSHQPISRLFTVRLDDGTVIESPLLVSDLEPARG